MDLFKSSLTQQILQISFLRSITRTLLLYQKSISIPNVLVSYTNGKYVVHAGFEPALSFRYFFRVKTEYVNQLHQWTILYFTINSQ